MNAKKVWALGLLVAAAGAQVNAQTVPCPEGSRWPSASAKLYSGMPNQSPSGVPWSAALAAAANEWSKQTRFTFDIVEQYRDPCQVLNGTGDPAKFSNGADFSSDWCGGLKIGENVLAIATMYCQPNILGSQNILESYIIFNGARRYDIYDGPQRFDAGEPVYDFRRVALHELGHALGLVNHDNTQPAIMAANIGNLFRLQTADINRVNRLYGGPANCDSRQLRFGWNHGQLLSGDCRVQQLMGGGTDQSFVDVYTLHVPEQTTLTFDAITDGVLDSVLLLTDSNLRILAFDEGSAGNCNPRMSQTLDAGNYVLLVNTYSNASIAGCGRTNTGDYRVSVTYQRNDLMVLSGAQSFQGGQSDARFLGAVTSDGGRSYNNRVSAQQLFDVVARIEPDKRHVGQSGFIVIAGLLGSGEILVKNAAGDFVEYRPEQELIPIAERRTLGDVENINILAQMVASEIGIETIEVSFMVGYGVDANPQELYFHEQTINLIVE